MFSAPIDTQFFRRRGTLQNNNRRKRDMITRTSKISIGEEAKLMKMYKRA